MFLEAINIFTHIYSQITRRWLSLAKEIREKTIKSDLKRTLGTLSVNHWGELFYDVMTFFPHLLSELQMALEKNPGLTNLLIKSSYEHLQRCIDQQYEYILFVNDSYPKLLKLIDIPPMALTVKGDMRLLARPNCAVVGSRKTASSSVKKSFEIGRELAEKNIVVVSGGAYGCDIAAHLGVLSLNKNQAEAILVFAGGLDRLYPQGNAQIFARLEERQALFVTEKLCKIPCLPVDFPVRNRIISGLCSTVLLIQASEKSGALITASFALDQGRDVFVYKACEEDIRFSGNKKLLEEGAIGFETVENLLVSSNDLQMIS